MPKKSLKKQQAEPDSQSNIGPQVVQEDVLTRLMRHYSWGVQDMDTRRTRKNGWNDVINAYMGKLPVNWPYNSVVTDPRIRTTILEKTSRLINAKLQGRLIPRDETGDYAKAKIQNALLDFQWDAANEGGSMTEKVAMCDQYSRIFGAAFVFTYWDTVKESNEVKLIDPRDLFFDGAATHVKNARWVQIREFTTFDKLEQRGFDVDEARDMAENGEITAELRSTRYESMVKANRGLVDRTGMIDDLQNPTVEIVTEWGTDKDQKPYCILFMPKYSMILKEGDSPYKHGRIPLSMLRYYPLHDDLFGESEVESVLPLQRAINAMLCGFLDESNIKMRPPLKISSSGVRIETIEYGPGAKWIMNSPSAVEELEPNGGFISTFNAVYPMLLSAYNTAMGDQSLGVANGGADKAEFGVKTATEVMSLERQQNSRDQANQLYLGEFLKDVMMLWLSNNKQFLFDDPTKKTKIIKIVGKENIKALSQMQLSDTDIPSHAMNSLRDTIMQAPNAVSDRALQGIVKDVSLPTNPVVLNPNDKPEDYQIKPKLDIKANGQEADLYVTPEDFEGEYDYMPDVRSMAAGTGMMMQHAREKALEYALNPEVIQMLQTQGQTLKIKELLVANLEDAGYRDAESLFEQLPEQSDDDKDDDKPQVSINFKDLPPDGQVQAAANADIQLDQSSILAHQQQAALGSSPMAPGPANPQGMGGLPPAVPGGPGPGGLPQPQGLRR